ncbi:hypothetical protein MKW94_005026 [Papaver nudicaule]|uniref:Uncharacterized GPI-anchored protein At5g19230-like domain-containing protein n=1 Tax=Papaver nudicaule TaxID=74823 RepID=A0AA41RU82_PAPNU|nr:hypothetical protein [Papaver nudicaule]
MLVGLTGQCPNSTVLYSYVSWMYKYFLFVLLLSVTTIIKLCNFFPLSKKPCTNTTDSFTVPGTETQFAKYPQLLEKCHLNINDTKNGVIIPVCVPKLDPTLVLTSFTQSQYSAYLNDTKYTRAGVGSEDDWIVMVLTTSSPGEDFTPAGSAASVSDMGFTFLLISSCLVFVLAL